MLKEQDNLGQGEIEGIIKQATEDEKYRRPFEHGRPPESYEQLLPHLKPTFGHYMHRIKGVLRTIFPSK